MYEPRNTPRGRMSTARRLRIWGQHDGICVLCKIKIDGVRERWIVEHLTPLAMGGPDTDDNCGPAHEHCAKAKTATVDTPWIAKTKRQRAAHIGAKQPSRRPMPGSRNSPWKRRMDGTTVPR